MCNFICDAVLASSTLADQVEALGRALPDFVANGPIAKWTRDLLVERLWGEVYLMVPGSPGQCVVPPTFWFDDTLGLSSDFWSPFANTAACEAIYILSKSVRVKPELLQKDLADFNATLRGYANRLYRYQILNGAWEAVSSIINQLRDTGNLEAAGELYRNALTSDAWISLKKAEFASGSWTNRDWELYHHWIKLSAMVVSDAEIDRTITLAVQRGLPVPDSLCAGTWRSWTKWLAPLGWADLGWSASDVARIGETECRRFARTWRPAHTDFGPPVGFGQTFRLRASNGKYVATFADKYSAVSWTDEYFATLGPEKVTLRFTSLQNRVTSGDFPPVNSGDYVYIESMEPNLGKHKYLGKFRPDRVYYYEAGYEEQKWRIVKVTRSDGPVHANEEVFIVNSATNQYLSACDDNYIGAGPDQYSQSDEPYSWFVEQV